MLFNEKVNHWRSQRESFNYLKTDEMGKTTYQKLKDKAKSVLG